MRYVRNLGLLVAFVFLCGFGGGQTGNGSGGGGTSIGSGAGDFGAATSQSGSVLTGVVARVGSTADMTAPPAIGGTTPAAGTFTNLNQVNSLGSTTTPACNFNLGRVCTWVQGASAATLTVSNIPGTSTSPQEVALVPVSGNNGPSGTQLTLPSTFRTPSSSGNYGSGAGTVYIAEVAGGGNVPWWLRFFCDGTNCYQEGGAGLQTGSLVSTGGTSSFGSTVQVTQGGAQALQLTSGSLLSVTGGTAPTATCSGGSTGVVVSAGNTSCTASVTPFPCCTGNGAGTCSNSTDNKGTIQTSSSASTSCTITFNHTWVQTPMCVFDDGSSSTTPTAFAAGIGTTTTYIFNFASTTSKVVNWVCL